MVVFFTALIGKLVNLFTETLSGMTVGEDEARFDGSVSDL